MTARQGVSTPEVDRDDVPAFKETNEKPERYIITDRVTGQGFGELTCPWNGFVVGLEAVSVELPLPQQFPIVYANELSLLALQYLKSSYWMRRSRKTLICNLQLP